MKPIIISLLAVSFFGCDSDSGSVQTANAEGPCAGSAVVGIWDFGADIIGFGADCSFFMQGCDTRGTYEPVYEQSGTVQLTYIQSNGLEEDCIPGGYIQHCLYVRGPDYLDLDCPPME